MRCIGVRVVISGPIQAAVESPQSLRSLCSALEHRRTCKGEGGGACIQQWRGVLKDGELSSRECPGKEKPPGKAVQPLFGLLEQPSGATNKTQTDPGPGLLNDRVLLHGSDACPLGGPGTPKLAPPPQ